VLGLVLNVATRAMAPTTPFGVPGSTTLPAGGGIR
jgi:hypothetical protein